jgi:hypothetical protein
MAIFTKTDILQHDHLGLKLAAVLIAVYLLGGLIYRLYFSPIAKFPGPKLAAATLWYEFYYDVIKSGQYIFEIERMHKKYGKFLYTTVRQSSRNSVNRL